MNIEQHKPIEQENNPQLSLIEMTTSFLHDYLEPNNQFLNQRDLTSLSEYLPQVLSKITVGLYNSGEQKITIGGTIAESTLNRFKPNEYWELKKSCREVSTQCDVAHGQDENEQNWRNKAVTSALKTVGLGDPDLDIYVPRNVSLEKLFEKIAEEFSALKEVKSDIGKKVEGTLGDNLKIFIYVGPAYKGSKVQRLHLQLLSQNDQPVFHVDITQPPKTGKDAINNRRSAIGTIHNQARVVVNRDKEDSDQRVTSSVNNASEMSLQGEKDTGAYFEGLVREMRKWFTGMTSVNNKEKWNSFSFSNLFAGLTPEAIFELKELNSRVGNQNKSLIENQVSMQQRIFFQEIILMGQLDPYNLMVFLQDTGTDILLFDRHINKDEFKQIVSDPALRMYPDDATNQKYPNSKEMTFKDIEESRIQYLQSGKKDGFIRLIKAWGNVLGNVEEKEDERVNLEECLAFFKNPEKIITPVTMPETGDEVTDKMLKIISQYGGMTEKGLHKHFGYIHIQDFRQKLFEIIPYLETTRRVIKHGDKTAPVNIYSLSRNKSVQLDELTDQISDSTIREVGALKSSLHVEQPEFWQSVLKNSEYTEDLLEQMSREFALAIAAINYCGINTLEALLALNEVQWKTLKKLHGWKVNSKYDTVKEITSHFIAWQKQKDHNPHASDNL